MFLKKGWTAAKASLAAAAFKTLSPISDAGAATGRRSAKEMAEGLSLREIADRRLHHGHDRFHNPFTDHPHGGLFRVLNWKLFSRNRFRQFYDQEPVTPVTMDWEPIKASGGVSVTLLKHASVLIKDVDAYLLIDPVYFGIFGFVRDFSPLAFAPEEIPAPRHVLVTHGHYDHLDKKSLGLLPPKTHIITPLGYGPIMDEIGLGNHREMDWFDTHDDGARQITLLPCNHWTMRNPFVGPNRALWGSYMIRTAGGATIYVSGDTGYFDGFLEIGRAFDIDLAIINLGAYEPRWFMKTAHLNPQEAIRAFEQLNARRLMIAHWGTFRLGDEPVHFPPMDIRLAAENRGLAHALVPVNLGQTYFFNGDRIA